MPGVHAGAELRTTRTNCRREAQHPRDGRRVRSLVWERQGLAEVIGPEPTHADLRSVVVSR